MRFHALTSPPAVRSLLADSLLAPLRKLAAFAQAAPYLHRGKQASLGHLYNRTGQERHPVVLVGAGPGSADLVTLRGAKCIQKANIIFYDRLVDPTLLDLADPKAERVFVGKAPGHHSWSQDKINQALVDATLRGKRVLRLKCGDPGIFARGAEEASALAAAGLAFEIVPGVTAASACAAYAGIFMTERGSVDTLVLTTATGQDQVLAPDWVKYMHRGTRIALYMAVHVAPRISAELHQSGLAREIEVTIVSRLGHPEAQSRTCRGTELMQTIHANDIKNPAIIFLTLPKDARRADHAATSASVARECRTLVR